jgi:hypothetical protein
LICKAPVPAATPSPPLRSAPRSRFAPLPKRCGISLVVSTCPSGQTVVLRAHSGASRVLPHAFNMPHPRNTGLPGCHVFLAPQPCPIPHAAMNVCCCVRKGASRTLLVSIPHGQALLVCTHLTASEQPSVPGTDRIIPSFSGGFHQGAGLDPREQSGQQRLVRHLHPPSNHTWLPCSQEDQEYRGAVPPIPLVPPRSICAPLTVSGTRQTRGSPVGCGDGSFPDPINDSAVLISASFFLPDEAAGEVARTSRHPRCLPRQWLAWCN